MTNEEAIERIKDHVVVHRLKESRAILITKALNMAISALEKQVPKKPLLEGDGYYDGEMVYDGWRCPNCDEFFEIDEEAYKYCPECGQQIDWTEEGAENE